MTLKSHKSLEYVESDYKSIERWHLTEKNPTVLAKVDTKSL